MIKRFLKWWNRPTRYEQVKISLDQRPKCVEIIFRYENGRHQRLTDQEATDYFRYLWFLYHGYNSGLEQMHTRKWQWQEKQSMQVGQNGYESTS